MNLQLLNHIKSCESKKARSFIDGILAQHNNAYGKALVRVMLHDAAEELNKAIPAFYTDISELDDLLFSENEENGLYKAIFSLCSTMHQAKIKDEEMLYHKAESIIQKSYSNQMLSAALVSKALEISPSVFSILFKKYSEEDFPSYVNRLRTEKSVDYLLSSTDTIESIAKAVGYSCTESYIRAFKRYKKVTPGAFRNL